MNRKPLLPKYYRFIYLFGKIQDKSTNYMSMPELNSKFYRKSLFLFLDWSKIFAKIVIYRLEKKHITIPLHISLESKKN